MKVNSGFWEKVKAKADKQGRPMFVLAPMADVTDVAFRQMIAKYGEAGTEHGGPDVFWTEFVSCDGLCSGGRDALLRDLAFTSLQRPIVAQVFGSKPENFYKTAKLVKELGFDGIDINMGCPDKSIEKQGAGASLMKRPELAREIILKTMEGAGDMPVSVKTRLGYNSDVLENWLPMILETKPAVVTVHARTRKDLSLVPARWERVRAAVEMARGSGTMIIGNGDVQSLEQGDALAKETGADGVMIGRGVFGNPWLFNRSKNQDEISLEEKLGVMVEHTKLFENLLGDIKSFAIMKKHYKAYVNGFDGAKELRMKMMDAKDSSEIDVLVKEFLNSRVVV